MFRRTMDADFSYLWEWLRLLSSMKYRREEAQPRTIAALHESPLQRYPSNPSAPV